MSTSPKQIEANRNNSQLSTGPRTEAGKAKSSMNAARTGLTGRTVLLPADDADAYDRLVARFACDWNPIGDRECELVQSMADTQWRLNRIPMIESGIYAVGRIESAALFPEYDAETRALLIEHYVFQTYSRQLNNISLQESRLRRYYAKDTAELKTLQAQRQEETAKAAKEAEQEAAKAAVGTASSPASQPNGFEFSTPRIVIPTAPLPQPACNLNTQATSV